MSVFRLVVQVQHKHYFKKIEKAGSSLKECYSMRLCFALFRVMYSELQLITVTQKGGEPQQRTSTPKLNTPIKFSGFFSLASTIIIGSRYS